MHVVHTGRGEDPRAEIPELGFRDYWYPLLGEHEVPRRRPRQVVILSEKLCVFRGANGVAAIADVCPHRGAQLSGGRCHYRGTVSCPYHGWTFNESGSCAAVLSEGPESQVPGKGRVRVFPTVTLKGVVFVWMGEGAPTPPEQDLPPELFGDEVLLSDHTVWRANWRPALENFQDNHGPYVHRNSVQVLMAPFLKASYKGSRAVINGGGVHLTSYADGSVAGRPYREWFPGVDGLWPKHRYRVAWAWLFRLRGLRWLSPYNTMANFPWTVRKPAPAQPFLKDPEWAVGPHMPGMTRLDFTRGMYTRWCVPIDDKTTREYYLYAIRPKNRVQERWERLRYQITLRLLNYRNFGMQDGRVLEKTRYDAPERFSPFDVETIGWRRLAILSARHGGRHDRIPRDVIDRLNTAADSVDVDSVDGGPTLQAASTKEASRD
jgi:nitrite reductase/ring-hydroxylating ferredoxin subunit